MLVSGRIILNVRLVLGYRWTVKHQHFIIVVHFEPWTQLLRPVVATEKTWVESEGPPFLVHYFGVFSPCQALLKPTSEYHVFIMMYIFV